MAKATGFQVDLETGNIEMNAGDTGSFSVTAEKESGNAWTDRDRMLWTVKDGNGAIVMQRIYRLDTALGNGVAVIQFHNSDTDTWEPGIYSTERRYGINPRWKGGAPSSEAECIDALITGDEMIEGDTVRTVFQGQLTVLAIQGKI